MQNYSPALKTNVNSGPIVFSKGVYNSLPASTMPRGLVQTYPFTDYYQEIMKPLVLLNNNLDHGPFNLQAVDFERLRNLDYTVKTGRQLTTVQYVQDTVQRWASYVASQDIDVSGNKVKRLTELKFLNDSALTESATDLLLTVPAGDLKISADEVNVTSRNLNVKNILTDPQQSNAFAIVHADRQQAISFERDGSIKFQVGKADAYGTFYPGKNSVSIDYYGRLCASIISPTIDVTPSLLDGVMKWTLATDQELPSSFCLPDISYTGTNHRVVDGKNYIVNIELPTAIPSSFVYTTLILNNTSGANAANLLIDAKKVLTEFNYLINFNDTLTISAGSACSLTISKSSPTSKYTFQFNLLCNLDQATLAQLDNSYENIDN